MELLSLLGWAAGVGAVISMIVYVYAFIARPRGDRLMSTMGLFFTAIGLSQIPLFLREGAEGPAYMNAAFCIVSLLAAAAAQGIVALRARRRPDQGADTAEEE